MKLYATLIYFKLELQVLLKTNFFFQYIINLPFRPLDFTSEMFVRLKALFFLVSSCNGLLNLFLTSEIPLGRNT